MRFAIVLAAALLACSSSKPNEKQNGNGTGSGSAPVAKPEDAMKQAIYPADALLAWLNQLPTRTMVRLPVLVEIAENKTYVESSKVGDKPDALVIDANDNLMGVPIAGKWGFFCKQGNTCMLMLTGEWIGGQKKQFQVREIEKAIPDADRATATFAEVIK
jgi:hypothetical protein